MHVEFEIKNVDTELIVVCRVELGADGFEQVTDVVAWTVFGNEEYDLDEEEMKAVEEKFSWKA